LKRLLLAIVVAALIAALMAPAAQAQGNWHWCWNGTLGLWDRCWWDGGGVGQEADQSSDAGEITQTFTVSHS
jgi:Ni/Co efflux regulator RcnB